MKVIVSDIPKDGLDLAVQETIESDIISSPITARLKIERIGPEVIVRGDLTATATLQCSRCLKNYYRIISVPVDVVYHPVEELKGEDTHEIKIEELDLDFYSGEELDLIDLLKEQIVLNMPMKPLCTDSCKGICPKCGTDLNVDKCKCNIQNIHLRFESLKKLLQ